MSMHKCKGNIHKTFQNIREHFQRTIKQNTLMSKLQEHVIQTNNNKVKKGIRKYEMKRKIRKVITQMKMKY